MDGHGWTLEDMEGQDLKIDENGQDLLVRRTPLVHAQVIPHSL